MRNFKNLSVWEKSHQITLQIYHLTSEFPKSERYGLSSQMRRSASSIPSNIAEGCGRDTQPQLANFINIASGSASELEYQMILSKDLEYINQEDYKELTNEITREKRMLYSLHKKIKSDI